MRIPRGSGNVAVISAARNLAVLTNKPVKISVRILERHLELARNISVSFTAGIAPKSRTRSHGEANVILREFRTSAREAVVVGDSEVDIQTARNAGTLAVAVNYGFGVHDREAHPADVYLEQIQGFASAA